MPKLTPDQFLVRQTDTDSRHSISAAAGLTQFGAFIEILQPGARSFIKHWHSAEDEMVYVLEGEVTLVEGETETVLRPGDAAAFRAGTPVGHCLKNLSNEPTRCMVVGTRAAVDVITYPDHDRVLRRDRSLSHDAWTTIAGAPAASPY